MGQHALELKGQDYHDGQDTGCLHAHDQAHVRTYVGRASRYVVHGTCTLFAPAVSSKGDIAPTSLCGML